MKKQEKIVRESHEDQGEGVSLASIQVPLATIIVMLLYSASIIDCDKKMNVTFSNFKRLKVPVQKSSR